MADTNLIKDADVSAKTADVEFVLAFEEDVRKLSQTLSCFEPVRRNPGTTLKYYKTSGTLLSGAVGEGEAIPLSKYTRSGEKLVELTTSKWAKETSYEAIQKNGYDEAVSQTDRQFIRDIQKGIRTDLFTFLATGTGKGTDGKTAVSGKNLQETLANIWGTMQIAFESSDATPICFINPLDVAAYLGTANITNSGTVAFGMTYLENFLGMYPTMLASNVKQGTIIATPQENLHIYYANASDVEGFQFEGSDETGYVGVHHVADYDNLTFKTVATSSMTPFCDYLDKIWVASINPATA